MALTPRQVNIKRLNQMQSDPNDRRHGTTTGYSAGCRCPRCSSVYSSSRKAYNELDDPYISLPTIRLEVLLHSASTSKWDIDYIKQQVRSGGPNHAHLV